jgi:hypothetical protein
MTKPSKYNASLQAATGLTDAQRKAAEEKFLELLELAFGSPSRVRGAYVEWLAARSLRAENPWDTTTPAELAAITLWEKAAETATRSVFSQMKISIRDAFFELHVWNSRTG